MIQFNFAFRNPFSQRFRIVYCKYGKIAHSFKTWEIQIMQDTTIVSMNASISICTDYAGIELEVGLLGYSLLCTVNDTRHWNKETGKWENYGQSN